jgi:hypothetical protein
MSTNYLAGFSGGATIGSQTISVKTWSASATNDNQDVTGTLSLGYYQYVPGLGKVSWSITGVYDGLNAPTGGQGSVLAVNLTNGVSGKGFSCATCIVDTWDEELDVAGCVTFSISGSSSGAFTIS